MLLLEPEMLLFAAMEDCLHLAVRRIGCNLSLSKG